jgi:hypothetical protein
MESSPSASYTVVALRASSVSAGPVRPIIKDVRLGRVALTLVVSIALLLVALHVPPFVAAGADLADSEQRDYAANIWQEMQTSLALLAVVLPWLAYGLLWQGAPWGRRVLLAAATAGVAVTTWFALVSAQSYTALPQQITGVVDRLQGRVVYMRGDGSYYLVISDSELNADRSWLRPDAYVRMWVSPRGHAGAVTLEPGVRP